MTPPVGVAPPACGEGAPGAATGWGASYALPPVLSAKLAGAANALGMQSNALVVNAFRSVLRKSLPFVSAYGVS